MSRVGTLLLGAGLIASGLFFVYFRAATPSDGAFLDNSKPSVGPAGLIVTPYERIPNSLRDGDVVVAVDGRSVEDYAAALPNPAGLPSRWRVGETITYTVHRDGQRIDVPVTLQPYALAKALGKAWAQALFGLLMFAVGAFVFARRPDDPAARLLFLFLAANGVTSSVTNALDLQVSDFVGGWGFWIYWAVVLPAGFAVTGAWALFALSFPQRHPVLLRHGGTMRLAATVVPAAVFCVALTGAWLLGGSALAWAATANVLLLAFYLVSLVANFVATIANFRLAAADPVAKLKAKWVMLALLTFAVAAGIGWVLPVLLGRDPLLSEEVFAPMGLVVPVALAIAILRHNIFDVDLLFNRTLVYGSLLAIVAVLYWATVVILQRLLQVITGERSDLAVVVTTLAIAATLSPLRQRLQEFVDRRFDRRRYDAARTLSAFSASVRDEVDLTRLTHRLASVVEETMQARDVSVRLRAGTVPGASS